MINPGLLKYEFVLDSKYYLRELLKSITLEESLEEIACRANVEIVITPDFPGIAPGQPARVSGVPFAGGSMSYLLHPGVVWDCESETSGQKSLTATIYDLSIYLAKSEEEYLLPAGQTASDRLKKYASDWGVPVASIVNTGISLDRAVRRAKPLWAMIMDDLTETVSKGGEMYRPRMTPDGLSLVKVGSNETVWVLESDQNIEKITQKRTLEGVITQVKVLGNAKENQLAPVLSIVKKDTDKYGTLQKVIEYDKSSTAKSAKSTGELYLAGIQETITVSAIDINTMRAGDKTVLNDIEYIVASITHQCGSPGHMTVELASADHIRRTIYGPV